MRIAAVPALIYGVACIGCRKQVRIPVFRASFYSFATYRGATTKDFYRVDLDAVHYKNLNLGDLLDSVSQERENGGLLELVPDAMTCPECGESLGLTDEDLRRLPKPDEATFDAVLV